MSTHREITVGSQMISDDCRETHGDSEAIEIALKRIKEKVTESLDGIQKGQDFKFEIKFVMHRPKD